MVAYNVKAMMKLFRESVERLALDAEEQIRRLDSESFPEFINVDELALEFDDAWVALKWRWEETGWTLQALDLAKGIDLLLDCMHGSKYWDDDGLREASEWQDIRRIAEELVPHLT